MSAGALGVPAALEQVESLRKPLQDLGRVRARSCAPRPARPPAAGRPGGAELGDRLVGSSRSGRRRARLPPARPTEAPDSRPRPGPAAAPGSSPAGGGSGRPRAGSRAPERPPPPARSCPAAGAARARRCARPGRLSRRASGRRSRRRGPGRAGSPDRPRRRRSGTPAPARPPIRSRAASSPNRRAGQRHQPRTIPQQRGHLCHLRLPADERRRRPRQIRVRDRLQRREPLLPRAGRSRPAAGSPSAGARRGPTARASTSARVAPETSTWPP